MLETLSIPAPDVSLPHAALALLREAEQLEREFQRRFTHQPHGGFLGSDYARVYATLHRLEAAGPLRGRQFCEWGSGSGVVTLLAELLGFESSGIEIQRPLVSLAQELATQMGSSASFACGSFVPDGVKRSLAALDHDTFLDNAGEDGHLLLELDPTHIDLVYCYPWPGEEDAVEAVFERAASPGALLVTYRGAEELTVQQNCP